MPSVARKNVFVIGRKGHEGDENQLTEMLAYVLQEEPNLIPGWLMSLGLEVDRIADWKIETQRSVPGGFLDLVLFAQGQALVIVESKLGSTTDFGQISKYVHYARRVPVAGTRALIFMTQHPEPWPPGIEAEAAGDVELVLRRWQALADYLLEAGGPLARDFVTMLGREGLVMPNALTIEDWRTWREGFQVARRLGALLKEAGEDLQGAVPGFKKAGAVNYANTGAVYRPFEYDGLSLYVGFWPSRSPKRATDHALITVYALNTSIPIEERKLAGEAAVEKAASDRVAMSGWSEQHIVRTAPAHEVLAAGDFVAQCKQLVDHVADAIEYFRDLGYLGRLAVPTGLPSVQDADIGV